MAVFVGTFENKIDRKGRVSVPAPFRTILQTNGHQQFMAFRSFRCRAIEACGPDFMEHLNASMNALATPVTPMKLEYTMSRAIPSIRLINVATAMAPDDFNIFDTRAG